LNSQKKMEMNRPELKVSDLKQYYYCPRVVYYQYVMPVDKAVIYKVTQHVPRKRELKVILAPDA